MFGKSEVMQTLRGNMVKVAATNAPVVITGECGTGKDIIARMIHRFSLWKGGSFVKISCPGRRETLLESELFGYEEGVSSCTFRSTPERVEMASGGTIPG